MPEITPHDHAAYVHQYFARLPTGPVWPRRLGTTLHKLVTGVTAVAARFAARAAYFVHVEAFPPRANELLTDWERVLGLPEPCLGVDVADLTIAERQAAIGEKLARRPGAQDRYYMRARAAALGYDVTITEYRPAQCALTQCGFQQSSEAGGKLLIDGAGCGTPAIRFVWRVTIAEPRLTWFAVGAGGGRCALDPLLTIARADDLECVLEKIKPAHTKLIFDYTGA